MLSFFFTKCLCYVVGITLPGYGSFRALETFDPADEKLWLTYWVVYALMETVEVFGNWILLWIPLFYELKLVLILWLIAPGTRGAEVLYDKFIWKFLHNYASKYDPTFKSDKEVPPEMHRQLFQQAKQAMSSKGPTFFEDLMKQGEGLRAALERTAK